MEDEKQSRPQPEEKGSKKEQPHEETELEKNKIIEDSEWEELWQKKKEYLSVKKYERLP